MKNDDSVHTLERGKNLRALEFWDHWTAGAFEFAHAGVAVDANNKHVAEAAGLLQALNVAGMEKIEAAVCEDDSTPVAFLAAEPLNRFFFNENARMQEISPLANQQLAQEPNKHLF